MKRILSELNGYTIETKDGKDGKSKDFLFDEKRWIIRYLEADFGSLFSPQRVLIPKVFFESPHWDDKHFPIALKEDEIEKCPKVEDQEPVSREYENELYKHFSLSPYWTAAYMGSGNLFYPPRPITVPADSFKEKDMKSILRSFKEVEGYQIHAIDGKIGHIEDLVIDDADWQIVYVVVDTKNWLPWSKKVLIAVDWIKSISYVKRELSIDLKTESIKNAPDFESINVIDQNYEESLYDFYSRSLVK